MAEREVDPVIPMAEAIDGLDRERTATCSEVNVNVPQGIHNLKTMGRGGQVRERLRGKRMQWRGLRTACGLLWNFHFIRTTEDHGVAPPPVR